MPSPKSNVQSFCETLIIKSYAIFKARKTDYKELMVIYARKWDRLAKSYDKATHEQIIKSDGNTLAWNKNYVIE